MFDPDEFILLRPYAGQHIAFELTGLQSRLFCILPNGLLQPTVETLVVPDLTLKGHWSDFARYLLGNGKAIQVSGDLKLAHTCQRVFSELDQDIGAWLDRLFGETTSNLLTPAIHSVHQTVKNSAEALKQDLREYLLYESDLLAPQHLLEEHILSIDELRHWAERLEARTLQLERKKS